MKKVLTIMLVGALALVMTTTAFANEPNTKTGTIGDRLTQIQKRVEERKAQIQQKKEDIEAFKAAALQKRDATKAAREQNVALLEQNKALREEISSILKGLKASGQILEPAVIDELKGYKEDIRALMMQLSETKGEIRTFLEANKGYAKALDYEALEIVLSEVSRIQSYRNEKLLEINQILSSIVALLQ